MCPALPGRPGIRTPEEPSPSQCHPKNAQHSGIARQMYRSQENIAKHLSTSLSVDRPLTQPDKKWKCQQEYNAIINSIDRRLSQPHQLQYLEIKRITLKQTSTFAAVDRPLFSQPTQKRKCQQEDTSIFLSIGRQQFHRHQLEYLTSKIIAQNKSAHMSPSTARSPHRVT